MQYIVLDLEFNQAFPFKTGPSYTTIPECPFEIIQIGAVKLDEHFTLLDRFNQLIRPQIYPRIHPFVEKITGITEEMLKDQPLFPEVFQDFTDFIGTKDAVLCTWGGDDIKSLFKNILYYDLELTSITDRILNVQSYASQFLHQEAGRAIGLKNAVTALQIPITDPFHDALHDAEYTAEVFRLVMPEKFDAEIFQPLQMTVKKLRTRVDTKALFAHFSELLSRPLSEEEKLLIKASYKFGRQHSYDIPVQKKKPLREKQDGAK